MSEPLVARLAAFATSAFQGGLPVSVNQKITDHIIDTIGVAIAAAGEPPVEAVRRVALTRGTGSSTVMVTGERLAAANAAFVNGTMAHALDFDDTHLPSILHPSASVVAGVFAVAEEKESSGVELIRAVAIGDEITCRLGMGAYDDAIGNSVFFENGLHATSICGALGVAAATATLVGLKADEVSHAMAIAASMGSGLLEANRSGGSVKPAHCGWAAHAGITATELAAAGMTGPPTILEGRFGFYRAHTSGYLDETALVDDLGDRWEVLRLFVKPYPTNHFTHAGIDAAKAIRSEGVDPNDIVEIVLGVPGPVLRTIARPTEEKARPRSGHHAKFSGPFTVASTLLGLGAEASSYTDVAASDPSVLELAGRVRCVEDREASAIYPHQFPAVLTVRLSNGTQIERRIEHTRGGPENPLTDDELMGKFAANVEPLLGQEKAREMAASLGRLAEVDSVRSIV